MAKPILTLPCKYTLSDFEQRGSNHHCNACNHSLHDFRNATEDEMQQAIAEANGKTCGIFRPEQVTAKASTFQLGLQRRVGLSLLGILGFVAPVVTSCEKEPVQLPEEKTVENQEAEAFAKLKFPLQLSGQLKDRYENFPLIGTTVSVCHGKTILHTVKTDRNGHFSVSIQKGELKSADFELVVEQAGGYKSDTIRGIGTMNAHHRRHLTLKIEAYPRSYDSSKAGFPTSIVSGNVCYNPSPSILDYFKPVEITAASKDL